MNLRHPGQEALTSPGMEQITIEILCFFSLPQPFRGEYLGLKENPKYRKLQTTANDKLVMADHVKKVNRGDGKVGRVSLTCFGFQGEEDEELQQEHAQFLSLCSCKRKKSTYCDPGMTKYFETCIAITFGNLHPNRFHTSTIKIIII